MYVADFLNSMGRGKGQYIVKAIGILILHYRGKGNLEFQNINAETVIYDIPAAGITSTEVETYGSFYRADITSDILLPDYQNKYPKG